MSALLADYIAGAKEYGGYQAYWQAAWTELDARDLGRLAKALRDLGPRKARGRVVEPRFSLGRAETAKLILRLIEAGVDDPDIRIYTGVSQSAISIARRESASRNTTGRGGCSSTGLSEAARSPVGRPKSRDPRTCGWCGAPLPANLRADAHFCPGGGHKQAAYRARQRVAA
jgi:hypothetical protein